MWCWHISWDEVCWAVTSVLWCGTGTFLCGMHRSLHTFLHAKHASDQPFGPISFPGLYVAYPSSFFCPLPFSSTACSVWVDTPLCSNIQSCINTQCHPLHQCENQTSITLKDAQNLPWHCMASSQCLSSRPALPPKEKTSKRLERKSKDFKILHTNESNSLKEVSKRNC